MFIRKLHLYCFILLIGCLSLQGVQRQPLINAINIEVETLDTISKDVIYSHINLKVGDPYSVQLVDQSIHALYNTGFFDKVEVKQTQLSDDVIALTFVVSPRYKISKVVFENNKLFQAKSLNKKIKSKLGLRLDEAKVQEDSEKLFEFYQKKGYGAVKISTHIEKDPATGNCTLTFDIHEGSKIAISEIVFEGNQSIKTSDLQDVITTKRRNIFSIFTGTGRIREGMLQRDLELLKQFYKERGYLDVDITENEVIFEYPKPDKVIIKITVHEGKKYLIGTVTLKNNVLFDTSSLLKLLKYKKGEIFNPTGIDQDCERIRDHYGRKSYLDTNIDAERVPNLGTYTIDLNYIIEEGEKCQVDSVKVQGNTVTKTNVVLREIALAPGDVFDSVRMKISQARLENTRFFKEVALTPESGTIPGKRVLKVAVTEGKTGSLHFGGGFSNIERGMIFVEYSQSNFDIFNYKTGFKGAGQKLRIRLTLGQKSREALLHFEEPYLFERELAFGFELNSTESRYESDSYNQVQTGLEVYFRKNLFELVEGRLFYRIEQIRITNVKRAQLSEFVLRDINSKILSKIGFELSRNTTDSLIYPTRGNRVELTPEIAGGPLGGDINYLRLEAKAAQWISTYETANQVLALIAKGGVISGYGHKHVPFTERYFLGGPDNLRGYDYRKIGGNLDDKGNPMGGLSFGVATAEYSFKLHPIVRFVTFYDIGVLSPTHTKFYGYNDNVGVGLRIFILGAPIRLDYGYPLHRAKNNKVNSANWVFNFSFGVAF